MIPRICFSGTPSDDHLLAIWFPSSLNMGARIGAGYPFFRLLPNAVCIGFRSPAENSAQSNALSQSIADREDRPFSCSIWQDGRVAVSLLAAETPRIWSPRSIYTAERHKAKKVQAARTAGYP